MAFSAKYLLVLAAILVQAHCGMVRRSAEGSENSIQDLLDRAKAQLQSVADEWGKLAGSTNFDEIKSVLEAKTKDLETRAKNVMDELKRQYEAHAPELTEKASAALNEATTRFNQTLEHLKSQAPGALEEMSALQQRFNDAFKSTAETMFEEAGKVAKAAGDDASTFHNELTTLTRNALTQTMDVMQQMQHDLQEAAKRATA